MYKQFGMVIEDDARMVPGHELKELLTNHGVIVFKGFLMKGDDIDDVMSRIGKVQNYEEQQAPEAYSNPDNDHMIYLTNTDFLGKSRTAWHMDQTYLETPYLPVRSLYSPRKPMGLNVTSFADVKTFTDEILDKYPELFDEIGRYYISEKENRYSERPIFSYCEHVKMNLLRLDARMEFVNKNVDVKKYIKIIEDTMEKTPKFHQRWGAGDLVIFDNNQCPHKRTVMMGECTLYRFTCDFWLE